MITKNLERSEIKKKEENNLCRHGGNPTDQQNEKPNLEQTENPAKIPIMGE